MVVPPVPESLHLFYLVVFCIGNAASWAFLFRYAALYKWHNNTLGRYVMSIALYCGLVFSWNTVDLLWGPFSGWIYHGVTLGLFFLLSALVSWRWAVFEITAREDVK